MNTIGIFFGSDTGNTEKIAYMIQEKLGENFAKVFDIANCTKQDLEKFNILIFGCPTWYYGEVQCDWDDFLPILKTIKFTNKIVSLFGCGDQEDYTEYFCDAIGIIHNIITDNGANIIGYWSTDGYNFESSKSLINEKQFMGLIIDEDRQPELTADRVNKWVQQVSTEMKM
ncbi:MAG: flavodoxin FldA [Pantoea sp. Brub]|nr:flavodoxin FldA [Pantoea sp. Brub]